MIHYICVLPSGEITNAGSLAANVSKEEVLQHIPNSLIVSEPLKDIYSVYWENNSIKPKGEQPSLAHVFDFQSKTWVGDSSKQWGLVVSTRNSLLNNSDWVVTKATELNEAVSSAWLTYRQALRDITQQSDPWNLVWPESP
jgi:hypothetical protein